MMIFAFVLQSPDVTPDWLTDVAAAVAVQLARDVAPAWGITSPRVQVAVYRDLDELPADVIPIVLLPTTDVAGDYGYHGEFPDGRFYARVAAPRPAFWTCSRAARTLLSPGTGVLTAGSAGVFDGGERSWDPAS